MSRSKQVPYEARDEDYDEDNVYVGADTTEGEQGQEEGGDYWEGGEGEYAYDGEEDEDEYGPGVTVIMPSKPAPPQTDLSEEHYNDPLALVNAWEEALLDFKHLHPERFLPPTEAPRSLAQKQAKAPIWYGPPPSAASTSKLPPPAAATPAPLPAASSTTSFKRAASVVSTTSTSAEQQPKKRKRLTGSQKKARKQAKLEAEAAVGGSGGGQEDAVQGEQEVAMDVHNDGPVYQPPEPVFAPEPAPSPPATEHAQPSPPAPAAFPLPLPSTSSSSGAAKVAHPSAFSFLVPPIGRLPSSIPPPPPIPPLTGDEPPLDAQTPAELMEAMLWSYYTAGYQTALYHAAVGVAKFKHEDEAGVEPQ
ncbi:hypothetical protein JCM10213_004179 [Rhodosporidiobolus nylandii]